MSRQKVTRIDALLSDARRFAVWWQHRNDPDDRDVVAEAERRGLLTRGRGLIYLTDAGKTLRARCRSRG